MASATGHLHSHPSIGSLTESQKTERANRRATIALFAGLVVLATVGITVSVIANALIVHPPRTNGETSALAVAAAPARVSLFVAPSWKKGPEGELHDAYSKTNFNVRVGQPVQLTIDNRDSAVHSITSGEAGVNIVVRPGVHTYTLVVHQAGHFKWVCVFECDPFSMTHVGYMQGYITAT